MRIPLTQLDPQFLRIISSSHKLCVDRIDEAQGLMFLCPACFEKNQGPVGTHMLITWFKGRGVPDDEDPKPGRWIVVSGTGYADLVLTASILISPSGSCPGWHGYVGQVAPGVVS